jgi:multidrug efflux pump subunit AcrA (membrane-fusion protein)
MKARYFVIPLFFLLLIWGLFTLMSNKEKFELDEASKKESSVRYVKILTADPTANNIIIEGSGRISTSQKVDISAEVQGLLIQSGNTIKPGVSFRKGQMLYSIRNNDARLLLQARKSSFMNLIANALPDLKLDYSNNYENWKNFFESIDVDKVLPNLPETKSQKEKTFISLKNIFTEYFNIKADEERLWKYAIVAPFDGSITDVFVEPGSVVNPGTRIATLIRTGDLEVEIPVDARNITNIKVGMPVLLTASSGNKTYNGKVIRMGEFVNATTQSIPVYVSIIKNKDDVLFNGMYLNAEINCGAMENTVKIPRRALPDENHFYVLKKKTVTEKLTSEDGEKRDTTIHAYSLVKKELRTGFVLKNEILALEIEKGEMIIREPVTQVTKESLFLPLKESKK